MVKDFPAQTFPLFTEITGRFPTVMSLEAVPTQPEAELVPVTTKLVAEATLISNVLVVAPVLHE
jgi:hypothetical protein